MRVTSKGQVTIPLPVREALGIEAGTEVDFELDGQGGARVLRREAARSAEAAVRAMRGRGDVELSIDQIMALTRG
jgi:AbrB family looped-hinge helix DNA binding protein